MHLLADVLIVDGAYLGHDRIRDLLAVLVEISFKVFPSPLHFATLAVVFSTLDEALMAMGINTQPLVSLISYVVVDKNDSAFDSPSKPVGPAFSRQKALSLPYPTVKTAKGYRRVVVSPKPVTIVEKREIKKLIQAGFIVICCGGGGISISGGSSIASIWGPTGEPAPPPASVAAGSAPSSTSCSAGVRTAFSPL